MRDVGPKGLLRSDPDRRRERLQFGSLGQSSGGDGEKDARCLPNRTHSELPY
jgi:hypothetical protein